jgi:hypothetical protein
MVPVTYTVSLVHFYQPTVRTRAVQTDSKISNLVQYRGTVLWRHSRMTHQLGPTRKRSLHTCVSETMVIEQATYYTTTYFLSSSPTIIHFFLGLHIPTIYISLLYTVIKKQRHFNRYFATT